MLVTRRIFLLFVVFFMAMTSARAEDPVAPESVAATAPEVIDANQRTVGVTGAAESGAVPEEDVAASDAFPPIVRPPATRGYDTRCWPIAARMATEPDALAAVELDLLQDCIAQLRAGVAVGDRPETGLLSAFCEARTPACPPLPPRVVCPPPPKPNLERLCPDFMHEQRQQRIDDRGPVRARPHLPGS